MTSRPADAPAPAPGGWRLRPARPQDAGELLTLTLAAFVVEAQRYGDPLLPPLREQPSDVAAALTDPAVRVVVAEASGGAGSRAGRLLGGVRVRLATGRDGVSTAHLGRLVVAPDARGNGLGSALLGAAEAAASGAGAGRVELFTGSASAANLALYERAGYARVTGPEGERADDRGVALVVLAKELPGAPGTRPGAGSTT